MFKGICHFGWSNETRTPFEPLLASVYSAREMDSDHLVMNGDANALLDSGHVRLHELGYKQELKRDLS